MTICNEEIYGVILICNSGKAGTVHVGQSLTRGDNCSIFFTIFRKGALLMNMYGFVSMMYANTENHVRTIVVYDDGMFREA